MFLVCLAPRKNKKEKSGIVFKTDDPVDASLFFVEMLKVDMESRPYLVDMKKFEEINIGIWLDQGT